MKAKKSNAEFDSDGYQTNLKSLNGEPLPDLVTLTKFHKSGFALPNPQDFVRIERAGQITLTPKTKGGARAGAGRKPAGKLSMVVRLQPALIAKVKARARREGMTISDTVAKLLAKV